MKAELKKSCSKCKYADWDADGCTCMIEKRLIGNAFAYVCDNFSSAKPLTNGDRIRQMDDEELAMFMVIQAITGAVSARGITDRNVVKEMVKEIMDSEDAKSDIEAAKEHLKQEVSEDSF